MTDCDGPVQPVPVAPVSVVSGKKQDRAVHLLPLALTLAFLFASAKMQQRSRVLGR